MKDFSHKKASKKRFIGIDLHTNKFNICQLLENSKERNRYEFNINDLDLERFIKFIDKNSYVMFESCANSFKFAELIKPYVAEVKVADSHKLKIISETNKKTDKVDAEKIAKLLKIQIVSGEVLINEVYVPEEEIQILRSLFTTYNQFKKSIVRAKNNIHSLLKKNLIVFPKSEITKKMLLEIKSLELETNLKFQIDILIEELAGLEEKQERVENQIKLVGVKYYEQIKILTSIKGISVLSALALISDIGNIKRFPNAKHLCSYLRSAPAVENSNEKVIIKKTNKFSRKLSMTFLTQSVTHFKNSNPKMKKWYNFKTIKTKKGKIRMATCRKLIVQIYNMLLRQEYHYFRDEKNHLNKLKEYNYFLKKNGVVIESEKVA